MAPHGQRRDGRITDVSIPSVVCCARLSSWDADFQSGTCPQRTVLGAGARRVGATPSERAHRAGLPSTFRVVRIPFQQSISSIQLSTPLVQFGVAKSPCPLFGLAIKPQDRLIPTLGASSRLHSSCARGLSPLPFFRMERAAFSRPLSEQLAFRHLRPHCSFPTPCFTPRPAASESSTAFAGGWHSGVAAQSPPDQVKLPYRPRKYSELQGKRQIGAGKAD